MSNIIWMYAEPEDSGGFCNIEVFSTEDKAKQYQTQMKLTYSVIVELEIDDKAPKPFRYDELKCPECDGAMTSRSGQYGKFWGCNNYPKCRGTRDSNGRSKAEREQWKQEQEKSPSGAGTNEDISIRWRK